MARPKLGAIEASFPALDLNQSLEVIAMLGLSTVDVEAFDVSAHLTEDSLDEQLGRDFARKAASSGLEPSDVFLSFPGGAEDGAANHPNPAVRDKAVEAMVRYAEFAVAGGFSTITGLPGIPFDGQTAQESAALSADTFARCLDSLSGSNLVLSFEPHIGSITETPEETERFLTSVPGLAVTLDPSHFLAGPAATAELRDLPQRTCHLHARQARIGEVQCRNEKGQINFREILASLKTAEFDGTISIEYIWKEWQGSKQVDVLSETAEMREELETYIAEIWG